MKVNQNINSTFHFGMWSEDQVQMVHNASLEILEHTGVVVHHEEALRLLADAGAYVQGNLAKIPAWMVEEAIRTAPGRIPVADATGKRCMFLESNNVYYGLGTDLPSFVDHKSQEIRQTVLSDVENVAKVTEASENIDFVASLGLASDVPQELVDLYHFKAMRMFCNKPVLTTATDYGNFKALIDMAAAQAGGYEQLRLNPSIILYAEPVSPLVNSKDAVDKLLLAAEYGIPVTYSGAPMSGGTGPMTLAGSIALGNAEGLAGLVMHQLKKKGSPFIYGIVYGSMDMKTTVDVYGGPEVPMVHTIVAQMARFYNLPSYGLSGATDSIEIDGQAGMESMYSVMCAALGGTSLTHDNGYLGAGLVGSLEKILFDDEVISFVKRFVQGVPVNEESLALDLIHEVGPGGDFMGQKHTAKHFRTEMWYPKYCTRKPLPALLKEGRPAMLEKLQKGVDKILNEENPCKLSPEVIGQFDSIIERRKSEINL